MKVIILVLSFLATQSVFAKASLIQVPNYLGQKIGIAEGFSHPVVYQSPRVLLSQDSQTLIVKMVTRWGTQIFELGAAIFRKNKSGNFEFYEWQSLAKYSQCLYVKSDKSEFVCTYQSKLQYKPEVTSVVGAQVVESFEQEIKDERRSVGFEGVEFPERGNQYWEYGSGVF